MKIHLLMTCYITDSRIQPTGYYQIEEADKDSQVLSTLYSLRKISFSSSEIRIALDRPYLHFANPLKTAVETWHPSSDFHTSRLEHFEQWQAAVSRIPLDTDWVLIMANHDHVFVQPDSSQLFRYLELLDAEGSSSIAHISHWTEALGWRRLKTNFNRPDGLGLWFSSWETIGTVAVQHSELKKWFAEDFTSGGKFVRPDNPFGQSVKVSNSNQSLPMVEFFRHLDGYGHIGLTAKHASNLEANAMLVEGKLVTRDYSHGDLGQETVDLLRTPRFYSERTRDTSEEIRNLIYLATAFRIRWKVVFYLLSRTQSTAIVKTKACLQAMNHPQLWKSLVAPVRAQLKRFGRS